MPMTSTLRRPPRLDEAAEGDGRTPRTVVIAVDGQRASIAALTWARDSLIQPNDRVRIVTAYSSPLIASEVPIRTEDLTDARTRAFQAALDAVELVFGTQRPGPGFEHVVALGPIERVLDEHAADAALVVVGTRRRRRWYERLMGSAVNRVTGRLDCPVVSIPDAMFDPPCIRPQQSPDNSSATKGAR